MKMYRKNCSIMFNEKNRTNSKAGDLHPIKLSFPRIDGRTRIGMVSINSFPNPRYKKRYTKSCSLFGRTPI